MTATDRPATVPLVLGGVFSVLILGGALTAPGLARIAGYAPAPADLSAVQAWDIADRTHAEGDITYPQTPHTAPEAGVTCRGGTPDPSGAVSEGPGVNA